MANVVPPSPRKNPPTSRAPRLSPKNPRNSTGEYVVGYLLLAAVAALAAAFTWFTLRHTGRR
jgi:uncharacterized protein HemX